MKCQTVDCMREAKAGRKNMCGMHYLQWWRRTLYTPRKEGEPYIRTDGYVAIYVDGIKVLEHRHLAELVLKRKLKGQEQVHHMNEDRSDNHTPFNLVICPDGEYHKLLHKRMKELGYANN